MSNDRLSDEQIDQYWNLLYTCVNNSSLCDDETKKILRNVCAQAKSPAAQGAAPVAWTFLETWTHEGKEYSKRHYCWQVPCPTSDAVPLYAHPAPAGERPADTKAEGEIEVTPPDEWGSMYVRFKPMLDGCVKQTRQIQANADYDSDGKLLGVEVLSAYYSTIATPAAPAAPNATPQEVIQELYDLVRKFCVPSGNLQRRVERELAAVVAPAKVGMPEELTGYWWCPYCKVKVDDRHVTYDEFHEECGHVVESKVVRAHIAHKVE